MFPDATIPGLLRISFDRAPVFAASRIPSKCRMILQFPASAISNRFAGRKQIPYAKRESQFYALLPCRSQTRLHRVRPPVPSAAQPVRGQTDRHQFRWSWDEAFLKDAGEPHVSRVVPSVPLAHPPDWSAGGRDPQGNEDRPTFTEDRGHRRGAAGAAVVIRRGGIAEIASDATRIQLEAGGVTMRRQPTQC